MVRIELNLGGQVKEWVSKSEQNNWKHTKEILILALATFLAYWKWNGKVFMLPWKMIH